MTHLLRLKVIFYQVYHLTELISHPRCQLKIVDAHRVVLGTPRVTEKQTEELIMALKKNRTIEAFYTHNDKFAQFLILKAFIMQATISKQQQY